MYTPWKNDGNVLARSILLVSKIVRKQGPIKIQAKLSELWRFRQDLCTHVAWPNV
jgi:hypothetical protein